MCAHMCLPLDPLINSSFECHFHFGSSPLNPMIPCLNFPNFSPCRPSLMQSDITVCTYVLLGAARRAISSNSLRLLLQHIYMKQSKPGLRKVGNTLLLGRFLSSLWDSNHYLYHHNHNQASALVLWPQTPAILGGVTLCVRWRKREERNTRRSPFFSKGSTTFGSKMCAWKVKSKSKGGSWKSYFCRRLAYSCVRAMKGGRERECILGRLRKRYVPKWSHRAGALFD